MDKVLRDRNLAQNLVGVPVVEQPLSFVGETPEVSLLRVIADRLAWTTYAAAQNPQAPMPDPLPRPVSALSVLERETVENNDRNILNEIGGW